MKRITKKREDGLYELAPGQEIFAKAVPENRLVQVVGYYEDLQDKLGMPLERLVDMLKNGFWVVATNDDSLDVFKIEDMKDVDFDFFDNKIIVYFEQSDAVYNTYKFKNYGRTWALTKEELE